MMATVAPIRLVDTPSVQPAKDFGAYLTQLRHALCLRRQREVTWQAIAEQINVKPGHISRWKQNHARPNASHCYDLARVFDQPIEVVLTQAGLRMTTFREFYGEVVRASGEWRDQDDLLPWLRYLITSAWTDSASEYVLIAHRLIHDTTSLRARAIQVVWAVRAWLREADEPARHGATG